MTLRPHAHTQEFVSEGSEFHRNPVRHFFASFQNSWRTMTLFFPISSKISFLASKWFCHLEDPFWFSIHPFLTLLLRTFPIPNLSANKRGKLCKHQRERKRRSDISGMDERFYFSITSMTMLRNMVTLPVSCPFRWGCCIWPWDGAQTCWQRCACWPPTGGCSK